MPLSAAAARHAPRVLVLGGSTEGFAVAQALSLLGYEVITSFAGRTNQRRAPVGFVRIGGFGGASGLAAYLAVEDIALVVDATHPFAAQIQTNAVAACADVGVPLVKIDRPAWTPQSGDDWRFVANVKEAAKAVPRGDGHCFVTIGRQGVSHFLKRKDLKLLFRVIDLPDTPADHPSATFIAERGPFTLESERDLFAERDIGCVVTKNSGGEAAIAKLVVARERGVPVIIIDRPPRAAATAFFSVEEAVEAASALLAPA